jgi:ABC-type polysaccharide/polyol phosphate export permease
MKSNEIYDSASLAPPLVEEMRALVRYRDLVVQFIARAIKTRYKRSVLGVVWTMLNPLLTMVVLTIVFSFAFRFEIEHYAVYVLCGLTIWNFFSSSSRLAMGDMIFSGYLFNRIFMPKSIFAVSSVGTGLINLLLSLIPLFLISIILGVKITSALLTVPFSIVIVAAFTLGVGLILSTAAVYFADVVPVYDVLLTIWMYATPIIYPVEILPPQFALILKLNPMFYMVEIFRQPIYQGVVPPLEIWGIAIAIATITLLIGSWLFTSRSNEYAYRI